MKINVVLTKGNHTVKVDVNHEEELHSYFRQGYKYRGLERA